MAFTVVNGAAQPEVRPKIPLQTTVGEFRKSFRIFRQERTHESLRDFNLAGRCRVIAGKASGKCGQSEQWDCNYSGHGGLLLIFGERQQSAARDLGLSIKTDFIASPLHCVVRLLEG